MMPKANDNSEEFDPVKIHFEKCCSALAFLYPWIFRTCKTAQGGSDVQGLVFSDLLRLLHQLHSPVRLRCAFCQNHTLSELSGKYISKDVFETSI